VKSAQSHFLKFRISTSQSRKSIFVQKINLGVQGDKTTSNSETLQMGKSLQEMDDGVMFSHRAEADIQVLQFREPRLEEKRYAIISKPSNS
jgi:hypothetical protein